MDQNAKQLIAEKIRTSGSFLVTVSKHPSVDQLASAIGLSLMLSALGKHSTSVFSGDVPNTMEFLEPEKAFDSSVDGLRDFIISISKDKADKLRYKVEDDFVKIFITPYKGKIDEKDLNYSQGDFNVDVVIALGVNKRDELDESITAHGRILHDAAIVSVTAGQPAESSLGSINWNDPAASSISEMLVSISEALQGGILDASMATAFLTGIVATTDRFSNDKTTPKIMTMSAQLMAAGANQQLIANNLQLGAKSEPNKSEVAKEGEEIDINALIKGEKSDKDDKEDDKLVDKSKIDSNESLEEIEKEVNAHQDTPKSDDSNPDNKEAKPEEASPEAEDPAIVKLEEAIAHQGANTLDSIQAKVNSGQDLARPPEPTPAPQPAGPVAQIEHRAFVTEPATDPNQNPSPQQSGMISGVKGLGPQGTTDEQREMGGTFNATSYEAHEQSQTEAKTGLNHQILDHKPIGGGASPAPQAPPTPQMPVANDPTQQIDEARRAIDAAMGNPGNAAGAYTPANDPIQALNAAPMPGEGELGGQIHIDNQGIMSPGPAPMPMNQPQQMAPPSPPPLPPMQQQMPQQPQQPQQQPQNPGVPQQMFAPPPQMTNNGSQQMFSPPPPPPMPGQQPPNL